VNNPPQIALCACFDKSFAELKESGLDTLEKIAERYRCGTKCGLCRPYIQQMLDSGETTFVFDYSNSA